MMLLLMSPVHLLGWFFSIGIFLIPFMVGLIWGFAKFIKFDGPSFSRKRLGLLLALVLSLFPVIVTMALQNSIESFGAPPERPDPSVAGYVDFGKKIYFYLTLAVSLFTGLGLLMVSVIKFRRGSSRNQ